MKKETLTNQWYDWVDYWSGGFNCESKRDTIRMNNLGTGEIKEEWTGDYVFEYEWQSIRTRKDH